MIKYKVLIVDDNEIFARELKEKISAINYGNSKYRIDIDWAATPSSAKHEISNHVFDFVILDTCILSSNSARTNLDLMRYYSGTEYYGLSLYNCIKERDPQTQVFVVSKLSIQDSRYEFNNAEAEYFRKNETTPERIASHIRNYFDTDGKRIRNNAFVVYGHNALMRKEVNNYLKRKGLHVFDLIDDTEAGIKTIFDKLQECIERIDCAVVLLSGDDIVVDDRHNFSCFQARQNVIFEMGLFAGALGKDKVIVLYEPKEGFKFPSDILGVYYIAFDGSSNWKNELKRDLDKIGFQIPR